jgi:hypothetical protein
VKLEGWDGFETVVLDRTVGKFERCSCELFRKAVRPGAGGCSTAELLLMAGLVVARRHAKCCGGGDAWFADGVRSKSCSQRWKSGSSDIRLQMEDFNKSSESAYKAFARESLG